MEIIIIVLGFALTIFVHELGHFLMAKKAGVKVEVFAIGMGPRIAKVYTDKQGTEYILSLLPIGGYVKLKGQSDIPSFLTIDKEKLDDDHYLKKTTWQRFGILIAGVVMNILFAFVLVFISFQIGVPAVTNVIGGKNFGFSQYNSNDIDIKEGDKIIAIDNNKVQSWDDVLQYSTIHLNNAVDVTYIRENKNITKTPEKSSSSVLTNTVKVNLQKRYLEKKYFRDIDLKDLGLYPQSIAIVDDFFGKDINNNITIPKGAIIESISFKYQGKWIEKKTVQGMSDYIYNHPGEIINLSYKYEDKTHDLKNIIIPQELTPNKGYYVSPIISIETNSYAYESGLRTGDIIKKINDEKISSWTDLVTTMGVLSFSKNAKPKALVTVEREGELITMPFSLLYNSQNEKFMLGVTLLQSQIIVASITPQMSNLTPGVRVGDQVVSHSFEKEKSITKVKRKSSKNIPLVNDANQLLEPTGKLFTFQDNRILIKYSLIESFQKSFVFVGVKFKETVVNLTNIALGKTSPKLMSGFLGIGQYSFMAVQEGLGFFLNFLAILGIGLAFINILPIPVLDGGHIVFLIYEMITGKHAPQKVYYTLHLMGFAFLIFVMLFVTRNDVLRMFF